MRQWNHASTELTQDKLCGRSQGKFYTLEWDVIGFEFPGRKTGDWDEIWVLVLKLQRHSKSIFRSLNPAKPPSWRVRKAPLPADTAENAAVKTASDAANASPDHIPPQRQQYGLDKLMVGRGW